MVIVKGVIEPMQISISGKNMDMGFAFQEHAEMALGNVVEKYFQNAISGHVTLERRILALLFARGLRCPGA